MPKLIIKESTFKNLMTEVFENELVKQRSLHESNKTTFECRTCANASPGYADGTILKPGWGRVENIDGPNAICPECIAIKDEILNDYADDGYPDARIVPQSGAMDDDSDIVKSLIAMGR